MMSSHEHPIKNTSGSTIEQLESEIPGWWIPYAVFGFVIVVGFLGYMGMFPKPAFLGPLPN